MLAHILSIGDELVSGMTVNTNSAWMAEKLTGMGIRTVGHWTVGDDMQPIVSAVRHSLESLREEGGGVLLISGGLGPTEDDLTRAGVAGALGEELVEDVDAVLQIERWFKEKGRVMSPSNRTQAMRPRSAMCIENLEGTAPGLRVEKEGVEIFVMPGVPREMRGMFLRSVLPELKERGGGASGVVTRVTKINTFGMGESVLGERIRDLMARGGNVRHGDAATRRRGEGEILVGTTVHEGIVSVRIYATGTEAATAAMTEGVRRTVRERLGAFVFGEGEETIEGVVGKLLLEKKKTVTTAESCTGGLLAKLLTDVSGASGYFWRGWVTYANEAKEEELGVPLELMVQHGAVSEEVAKAMAEGARKNAGTDFALSITGIAGPEGGTAEKPVGTTWVGIASSEGVVAKRFIFPGHREMVRLRGAQMALSMLRWKLMGVEAPI